MATPAALAALSEAGQRPGRYLFRHSRGDWGDLDPDDMAVNERALEHGDRLFSCYTLSTGEKLYVITEWDRSATTLLLPTEY